MSLLMNCVVVILSLSMMMIMSSLGNPITHGQQRNLHVIVIDAGSTGTRMNYYIFEKNPQAPFKLNLKTRITRRTTPGLSAYMDQPQNAYKPIVEMIQDAQIPQDGADLLVKATAGIRLLAKKNESLADAIMKSVKNHLDQTYNGTFFVCDNCVSILPGIYEGDYAWLAVNFLTWNTSNDQSVGVMDLGGASTQITFQWNKSVAKIVEKADDKKKAREFVSLFDAVGKKFDLYSHSYLGLGMLAARLPALKVPNICQENNCTNRSAFQSYCLHKDFKNKLAIGAAVVNVEGVDIQPEKRYETCLNSLKVSVENNKVRRVSDKKKLLPLFMLQSAYFSTFYYTGLVPENGADITLENIVRKAKNICERVVSKGAFPPYNCMNYCYIINLLHNGYGFAMNQPLRAINEIKGHSPDWALGLAVKEAFIHAYGN